MAGRPSLNYNPEVADEICMRISTSEDGLEQVIDELRLTSEMRIPSVAQVYVWLQDSAEFVEKYSRARLLQAQILHDRAQVQARTALIGVVRKVERNGDKETITETTTDNVERSKLIVSTTLKRASQLDPKKYGEKLDLNHGGEVKVKRVIADV